MQEFGKLLTGIWEKRLAGLRLLSGTGLPLWYIAKNPPAMEAGSIIIGYSLFRAIGILVDERRVR